MPKQQNPPPQTPRETMEQKLDRIAESLHRLDRRDRARTAWMTIRSIIGMIPLHDPFTIRTTSSSFMPFPTG